MATRKNGQPVTKNGSKKAAVLQATKAGHPKTEESPFRVICIGASAGGLNAVGELLSQLPVTLNAAVFVVLHLSRAAIGELLVERIKKNAKLPCSLAENNEIMQPGHIYIALPDAHLLIKNDRMLLGKGPAENRFRPSIDVLFRSAATYYRERTIGVILTGYLNDGTAGMWAIKQNGGHCVVQDPNEAEYPDMPMSVLETMDVDHCVSLNKMGNIILNIVRENKPKKVVPSAMVKAESKLSERIATSLEEVSDVGEKTVYSCPDCGGGLWKIVNGNLQHYRCHIGHSYSEKDLNMQQAETIEHTLWVAIRMMEERKILLVKMGKQHGEKGLQKLGSSFREQAKELDNHIAKMKELLFAINRS